MTIAAEATVNNRFGGEYSIVGPGKRVLMIAFHYPPCRGSSGLQRTLSFTRYLPRHGWSPIVLTAKSLAYAQTGDDQMSDIPESVPVYRALALDATRHLSFRGRYLGWMALPDSWSSWIFSALPVGMRLIRKHQPEIIWSTYPIATAHFIGYWLHRLSGLPWVADFRDPMTEEDTKTNERWPSEPSLWRARRYIENLAVRHASRVVFATDGARQLYSNRFADQGENRWAVIENGYDEEPFTAAEKLAKNPAAREGRPILLLHSGVLYPTPDRDPSAFFAALARLKSSQTISATKLRVVLRASGFDDHYRKLIRQHGIDDIVALEPAIPYRQALAEMLSVDGLLIFQGKTSNPAIPAKLYEYFRAGRPIFAMIDSEGDTARKLREARIGSLVPLDCTEAITNGLARFLELTRSDASPVLSPTQVKRFARESRTQELANIFTMLDANDPISARGLQ
jgi:glycosyltransferase involved in cell wall biosynthesis